MPAKKKLNSAYQSVNPKEMILRDHLAFDRTVLANERTGLAYARTAIALLVTGLMVFKIYAEEASVWTNTAGTVCVASAIVIGLIGTVRFISSCRRLERVYHATFDPIEIEEE